MIESRARSKRSFTGRRGPGTARTLDLLLTIFHPDMVWPWPPSPEAHDPALWVMELGRFDAERWRRGWQELFETHELVHNRRRDREDRRLTGEGRRLRGRGRRHSLARRGGPGLPLEGAGLQDLHEGGRRVETHRAHRSSSIYAPDVHAARSRRPDRGRGAFRPPLSAGPHEPRSLVPRGGRQRVLRADVRQRGEPGHPDRRPRRRVPTFPGRSCSTGWSRARRSACSSGT